MNKTLKEILIIILLSALSALLYNTFFNDDYSLIYREIAFTPGQVLSSEEAFRLSRSPDVLFIDARPAEDYAAGHIKGALNLPVRSSRNQKMVFMQKIAKEQKIVVYCIDSGCPSAERLMKELQLMGYKNIMIYPTGWLGWKEAAYPMEKGAGDEQP